MGPQEGLADPRRHFLLARLRAVAGYPTSTQCMQAHDACKLTMHASLPAMAGILCFPGTV